MTGWGRRGLAELRERNEKGSPSEESDASRRGGMELRGGERGGGGLGGGGTERWDTGRWTGRKGAERRDSGRRDTGRRGAGKKRAGRRDVFDRMRGNWNRLINLRGVLIHLSRSGSLNFLGLEQIANTRRQPAPNLHSGLPDVFPLNLFLLFLLL
jgi:hypothetical protein